MVLSLFQLQVYYLNEIKRGLAELGEYSLLTQFRHLREDFVESYNGSSPKDIVKLIKEGHNVEPDEHVSYDNQYFFNTNKLLPFCICREKLTRLNRWLSQSSNQTLCLWKQELAKSC